MARKKSSKSIISQLEKIKKTISDAKRMGADVQRAEELLKTAGSYIKNKRESEALKVLKEISSIIKTSKKRKRLDTMIFNTLPYIEEARKVGADVSIAVQELENAKKALDEGSFGLAQELINKARREADDAKRFINTKATIIEVVPIFESAKRRGIDITEPSKIILQAWNALDEYNYGVVKRLVKDAKIALKTAEEHKSFTDSVKVVEQRMETFQEAGIDISDMEQPLRIAKEALVNKNYARVKKYVNHIKRYIDKIILQREAGLTLRTIQQFIKQAKKAGIKPTELEGLFERASFALDKGEFSELQGIEIDAKQIAKNLKLFDKLSSTELSALDPDMAQSVSKWIQQEIVDSKDMLPTAKERGIDTAEVGGLIQTAENALADNNINVALRIVQNIRRTLGEGDSLVESDRVKEKIDELNTKMLNAKELGVDVSEVEMNLRQAIEMVDKDNVQGIREIITETDNLITETVHTHMEGKYPKLNFSITESGYEPDKWNKCLVEIMNTGSTTAKDIGLTFSGDVEVKGGEIISSLAPKETKQMEVAFKPTKPGKISLEVSSSYHRYFDDTQYQLNDMKEIEVDVQGSYIVEDVFLIYRTGILIAKESRRVKAEVDSDVFSAMLTAITQFVHDSFDLPEEAGLSRMEYGKNKLLIERGKYVFLALTLLGEESIYLPFYMAEIIKEVEEEYASVLDDWTGEMDALKGIEEIVKKIIFVKKDVKTEIPMLETSLLSPLLNSVVKGETSTDEISEIETKLVDVGTAIEAKGFEVAQKHISEMKMIVDRFSATPTFGTGTAVSIDEDELKKRIYNLMIRSGGAVESTALMDERLNTYFELVGKLSDAIYKIKEEKGIPLEQPLARVSISHPDYEKWQELFSNMKNIVLEQLNTTVVEIIEPGKNWDGFNIEVKINESLIRESYKHLAMNVISVLQFMPPEKMKSNVEKGSFTIGVEGQQIYISEDMVSIALSLPVGAIESDFDTGKLYLDFNVTEEMAEESNIRKAMNEIIIKVTQMREEMELSDDTQIEVQILAPDAIAEPLEELKTDIADNINAYSVEFPLDSPFDSGNYYVSEFHLQDETISIGIIAIESEEE